jgi:hypothetical protein
MNFRLEEALSKLISKFPAYAVKLKLLPLLNTNSTS